MGTLDYERIPCRCGAVARRREHTFHCPTCGRWYHCKFNKRKGKYAKFPPHIAKGGMVLDTPLAGPFPIVIWSGEARAAR